MLPIIPHDKSLHFIYGLIVAVVVFNIVNMAGYPNYAKAAGFLAAVGIGLAKEGVDWFLNKRAVKAGNPAPHTVSVADAVVTGLGGAILFAV